LLRLAARRVRQLASVALKSWALKVKDIFDKHFVEQRVRAGMCMMTARSAARDKHDALACE